MYKKVISVLVAMALIMPAPTAVLADTKDVLKGVAIGLGVGALVNQSKNKKKTVSQRTKKTASQRTKSSPSSSAPKSTVRRGDASIQTALNAFGFDAGPADGLFGKRTRAAISRYQASIGAAQTGKLTADQKASLLSAYGAQQRRAVTRTAGNTTANSSGATSNQAAVSSGVAISTFLASLGSQDATTDGSDTSEATHVPNMIAACDRPEINAIDGVSVSIDPIVPLAASFCTARNYAIIQTAAVLEDDTDEQAGMWAGCQNFFDVRGDEVLSASQLGGPDATVTSLSSITSGIPENQVEALKTNFETCLGLSLAAGEEEMSLVYSTLMTVLGSKAYGEVVAGQLALGLGANQTPEAAVWYNATADALDAGANPFVATDVEAWDHSSYLRVMAQSISSIDRDISSYLAEAVDPDKASSDSPLLALFQNPSSASQEGAIGRDRYAVSKAVPVLLDTVLQMNLSEAITACGNSQLDEISRRTCKALAIYTEDSALLASLE